MAPSYLRFPHLHGDSVVFVAEDDVWLAPVSGGRAYRLTADQVPAAAPRLSPDGQRLAWTTRREGAPEVYVADVEGGSARRLTYWGDYRTRTIDWAAEDELLAISAVGQPTFRNTWVHALPAAGGRSRLLPYGPVSDLALGEQGAVLLGAVMSREPAWWKRYRGGTAGKLWWDAGGGGEFVRIGAELDGNLDSPMLVGTGSGVRIAFLSDHEGWGNVYSLAPDGTKLRRHTDHGMPGSREFYARHAATDGSRVVYECAGELWLLDSLEPDAQPHPLDIRLGGPRTARAPHRPRAAHYVSDVQPDKTGRTSVLEVRGTVHRLAHRDGPARTLHAAPGVRARLPRLLGEDRAAWVDDADGEDALRIGPLDPTAPDAPEPQRFGAGEIGRVLDLACAPDGSRVAMACHDGRLLVLDTEQGTIRELARGADGEVRGLAFSPDSQWLAWSDPVEADIRRILMCRLTPDEVPVAVTEPRFVDTEPVFTPDGRYLAFLSMRSFDPVYDAHTFDLSFPAGCRPFLVPLAARTPSPFGDTPDGRSVQLGEDTNKDSDNRSKDRDKLPGEPADESEAGDEPSDADRDDDVPEVVVDADGLVERVVPVPVREARYVGLAAAKDCLLWLRRPVAGVLGDGRASPDEEWPRPALERFDLVKRRHDVIAEQVTDYSVSGDGSRLVVLDRGALRVLRTQRSGSATPPDGDPDEFEVDTDRISVTVDPTVEWRQMFDEAGRLMRDHFWVEDMAGVDWAGELARYRPLVDAVGSHDDLVDVLWEVQGELGTSHAYVSGLGGGDWSGRPGLLGADLERDDEGRWRIARVLPGETSDPRARSPLSGPGVDVRAGDLLLEVGGQPVDPELGPAPLLVGTAERQVELTVQQGGPDGEIRRVVVSPLFDDEQLRYQDWVAGRRAFVADLAEGRLGYLHVPDMMAVGWAQIHRDLGRQIALEGLIVDVRGNRGGHLSQLVLEKLARKIIGWDMVRHGQPATYPQDAPRGPVVVVANEFSASDGDIVTAAIKRTGIGPVVGTRTWGGVIGIDHRYTLVDGTYVTQPRYASWFDDVGWGVENHGVDPDVEVVVTPQDWVAGRDPQLERAVQIALATLAERPAATPPDLATRPSRARSPLPARRPARRARGRRSGGSGGKKA